MKLHEKKLAFITSLTATILFAITNLLSQFQIFEQIFVPTPSSKAELPRTYPFSLTLTTILLVFFIVFGATWLFARLYNKYSKQH